jgi:uncharacterized protein
MSTTMHDTVDHTLTDRLANESATPARQPGLIWWREPLMWLVVGGPAVVVVAALYTVWIAATNIDPLIDKRAPNQTNAAQHQRAVGLGDMPAGQARNHVATPEQALPVQ